MAISPKYADELKPD